ncbi:MAG: glycosyltransferase family 2 protein [Pseudomonadota bacterium]
MKKNRLKISIVTPSYNQGKYLGDCISSIINQNYQDYEHVIIDGGSKDNSIDVIKKNESIIKYWISEKDKGQYNAINKGFAKTDGDIMGWLNADDKYLPWTFETVSLIFSKYPQVNWISASTGFIMNSSGNVVKNYFIGGASSETFLRGANLSRMRAHSRPCIQQESTFWRRSLWEKAGAFVEETYSLASDYELWARYFNYSELYSINLPLACFRKHTGQKTSNLLEEYNIEALEILNNYKGRPYRAVERHVRKTLWNIFGNRNLYKLPNNLVSLFLRLHILYPVKLINWNGDDWEMVTDYVI